MKKEAKKSFAKFVNSLFAIVLVVGLMPTWAISNPTTAYAAPGDVTVTTTVDGLPADTLPVLVSGTDFTVGQPVNADPTFYSDASGNMPVADYAKQQAAKGLSLKWIDASTGKAFDWNETPITRSTTVEGTWVATQCTVTVSMNDGGKTADTVVTVPWGKSYASVKGGAPATPSRDGWQFLGWYTTDGKQFDFNSAVKESVVVEAKWSIADVDVVPTTDPTSDIPQSFSGKVWIGSTWGWHPAQFALSNFTGFLAGCSATGSCADRSAAPPSNVQADYSATLKSVNIETGEIIYDVYVTPPDATNGHDRNSMGLIGYQHVSAEVKMIKNFGGWVEINKASANTDITDGNGCYSLEGAEYAVYDQGGTVRAKLTTDANGYAKSNLLPSGNYTIKELKAPNGYALDLEAHGFSIQSGQTTTTNLKDEPQSDPVGTLLGKYMVLNILLSTKTAMTSIVQQMGQFRYRLVLLSSRKSKLLRATTCHSLSVWTSRISVRLLPTETLTLFVHITHPSRLSRCSALMLSSPRPLPTMPIRLPACRSRSPRRPLARAM